MKKHNKVLLVAIAAILCVASVIVIWHFAGKTPENPETTETTETDDQTATLPPTEGGQPEDEKTEKEYTVAFFDSAGHLIKEEQVEAHKGVEPPENFIPEDGVIFVGWDKDFSYVFSDIIVRPNYLDISSDKNYVYANAVYAKPEAEIRVKVKLGGQVNLAALQMYINYDESYLEYIEAANLDAGVMIHKEAGNPRIRLAFLAEDNVSGSVDFVELIFRVKGNSGDKAVIAYDIEKAAMIRNDEIVTADYTVKDTVIHIY